MRPRKKICNACLIEKEITRENFYLYKDKNKSGDVRIRHAHCRQCATRLRAEWRARNPGRDRSNARARYAKDPEKIKSAVYEWRRNNREKVKETARKCYEKHRDKIRDFNREYIKRRRRENPQVRLADRLRAAVYRGLKGQTKGKGFSALDLLGCSISHLKSHIESMFVDGMSWDNWSKDGWHIDHIVPLASFDLTDEAQRRAALHYTNLRPLWAKDNLSKGARHG